MPEPRDTFIHIADIHFWRLVANPFQLFNKRFLGVLSVALRRRHEFVLERAEPYADIAAGTGARCVILTGDFSSTSTDAELSLAAQFLRGLRQRGLAVHIVPGNHDLYTFESVRKRRFERHFADFIPSGGYPSLTCLPGGTPLLLVPTACPRFLSARGRVAPDAVEAAARLLTQTGPTVVVAGHYPLLPSTATYASGRFHRLANAEPLRRTLGEAGKRLLYLAGHVHRFSYVEDPRYAGVQHLTTGAFLRTDRHAGVQGEFTEVSVETGKFNVTRHVCAGTWTKHPVSPTPFPGAKA